MAVVDPIAVALRAAAADAGGAQNVTATPGSGVEGEVAGRRYRIGNADFAAAAGAALGRPTWMFTPRFVLNALLGEQATLVCDGQQVISRRVEHDFEYPDIESALADLV